MEEIFKSIEGYEELYQVSSYGRVKSLTRNKMLNTEICCGYQRVTLTKGKAKKHFLVHRLVAQAFIENPNNLPEVNHIDEDKMNNHVTNLEWCTRLYNANYGTAIERCALKRINNINRSKQVMCVETGVVYPSLSEAARQTGNRKSAIWCCCKGKHKTCGGLKWKYVS